MEISPTKRVGPASVGSPDLDTISIEASTLSPDLPAEKSEKWDQWVENESLNGTLFHTQRFFQYHPPGRFNVQFLRFFENTHQAPTRATLACSIQDGVLKSPVGASYGGFAIDRKLPLRKLHAVVKKLQSWCDENGIKEIRFTHAPTLYTEHDSQELDFCLLYNGFNLSSTLVSSAIDLNWVRTLSDPLLALATDARYSVRLSQRNDVQSNRDVGAEEFYKILVDNKAKFETKPAHTLEELKKLQELCPGKFQLFSTWHQEKMACGVYTFHCNPRVLLIFYIASRPEAQKYGAVQKCLSDVLRWAVERKYQFIDIGVSADTFSKNPMDPSWSLVFFKEQMGARGYLRPTYTWKKPAESTA